VRAALVDAQEDAGAAGCVRTAGVARLAHRSSSGGGATLLSLRRRSLARATVAAADGRATGADTSTSTSTGATLALARFRAAATIASAIGSRRHEGPLLLLLLLHLIVLIQQFRFQRRQLRSLFSLLLCLLLLLLLCLLLQEDVSFQEGAALGVLLQQGVDHAHHLVPLRLGLWGPHLHGACAQVVHSLAVIEGLARTHL
jgi:hypothetical protein